MQRDGARKQRIGDDAKLLLPNFYMLPALSSSQLSVFSRLCFMNTLLYFLLLLCQSCRSLRNVSWGGRILGLIKCAYHDRLSMMTSSEGPLFSLGSGPPTLIPPLSTVSSTTLNDHRRFLFLYSFKTKCINI